MATSPKTIKEYNPYVPNVLRWSGSVVPHVLLPTVTVTIAAAIVTLLYETFDVNLSIASTFTPIIGIVVGLLLTYRTNTAYDRYWEGRRLWATMMVHIRNLTRYIWVGVREDDNPEDKKPVGDSLPGIIVAKKSVLNLLLGFAIALKHYLREEGGCGHEDLKDLIANIKSKLPGFEPLAAQDSGVVGTSSAVKIGWYSKLFLRKLKPDEREKFDPSLVNNNLPLEITLYLSSYIKKQLDDKRITNPICSQLLTALNGLCDCLSQFERILRSPIPLAYSIHLSQTVWIYCLTLPFQFVSQTHWPTIPVVFFSALILFGLERIGAEIENPFGYDYNDLDLDDFCNLLKRELDTIASHPPPTVKDWVYAPENRPFEHLDLSATDAAKLNIDEVRSLLEKSSLEIQETEKEEKEENSKGKNKKQEDVTLDIGGTE